MGNYYGCAFRVLAVFRQLLTHGQKFDPEFLLWSCLIWNFAPIVGQQTDRNVTTQVTPRSVREARLKIHFLRLLIDYWFINIKFILWLVSGPHYWNVLMFCTSCDVSCARMCLVGFCWCAFPFKLPHPLQNPVFDTNIHSYSLVALWQKPCIVQIVCTTCLMHIEWTKSNEVASDVTF